jgi:hypothetical protein
MGAFGWAGELLGPANLCTGEAYLSGGERGGSSC